MRVEIDRAVVIASGEQKESFDGERRVWFELVLDDGSRFTAQTALLTRDQVRDLQLQLVSIKGSLQVRTYQRKDNGGRGTSLEFTGLQISAVKAS